MQLSQRPLTSSSADVELSIPHFDDLARGITDTVRRGRNVLVLGPRGAGRTSLLSLIEHRLLVDDRAAFRRVDAGPWSDTRELIWSILAALGRDPRGPTTRVADPVGRFLNPLAPREIEVPAPVNERDAGRIVEAAREVAGSEPLVFLLDNVDPDVAHDLFGRFRDTLWAAPVTWVATGDAARQGYLEPPADVFWERVEWLQPLSPSEVAALLRRRIDVASPDDPDIPAVTELMEVAATQTGEWTPRDVIRAAADAADGGSSRAAFSNVERLGRADAAGGRSAAMLLAELDQLGRPAHAGDPELMARTGLSRPRLTQLLRVLLDAGLVKTGREGRRLLYRAVADP